MGGIYIIFLFRKTQLTLLTSITELSTSYEKTRFHSVNIKFEVSFNDTKIKTYSCKLKMRDNILNLNILLHNVDVEIFVEIWSIIYS